MMMNKYLVCVKHLNSICSPSVMFLITVMNFTSAATVNCSYFPEFTTTKETVYYKSVNGLGSWAVTMCILVHMYQCFGGICATILWQPGTQQGKKWYVICGRDGENHAASKPTGD